MSDKTNGFDLREWIEKERANLYDQVYVTPKKITKPIYNAKIESLKKLQSALDKWGAEHKEEVCEWLETGISMTHGTRLFTPQCKTFQDMKDKTSYPFAKTDDTCIYCNKKIVEKEGCK